MQPDRNRGIVAALLFTLCLHLAGAVIFVRVINEAPRPPQLRPIEISVISPTPPKLVVPKPLPVIPKPVPIVRHAPPPVPKAVPVPPPKAVPAAVPQPVKMAAPPAPAQHPLPAQISREKSAVASAPPVTQTAPLAAAPVSSGKPASPTGADQPFTGPSYQGASLKNPVAQYPPVARRLRLQGTATVRVMVSPDGHPLSVRLQKTSGARVLDDAAVAAVQHWSFVPARRGNKTIAAEVDVPIHFGLD